MVAQVPMHQQTTGFVILPSLMPWQILYSSVPPICVKVKDILKTRFYLVQVAHTK